MISVCPEELLPLQAQCKQWIEETPLRWQRLGGGGNNQAWLLHTETQKVVLKRYFQQGGEERNRGKSEFHFSQLLHRVNITNIPKPLYRSEDYSFALYSYEQGVIETAPNSDDVKQAAMFIARLADIRCGPQYSAAEACLKNSSYYTILQQRIARLKTIPDSTAVQKACLQFVGQLEDSIDNYWRELSCQETDFFIYSPSDFGFHNCLKAADGTIVFLDFEYAGLDDPCKLVCDFFSQPRIPVPLDVHFQDFMECAFTATQRQNLVPRVAALMPMVRYKWCCILLNEFLHDASKRRTFAKDERHTEEVFRRQLRKAEIMYESVHNAQRYLREFID